MKNFIATLSLCILAIFIAIVYISNESGIIKLNTIFAMQNLPIKIDIPLNCNYITFDYDGRTGNNMFQYAAFYSIAKTNRKIGFIRDNKFPLLNIFNLSIPVLNISNRKSFLYIGDKGCAYHYVKDTEKLNCSVNYTSGGNRQSFKYFESYKDEIKREFQFLPLVDELCKLGLINISCDNDFDIKNCTLIGAHMRRGDFAYHGRQLHGHKPASPEYLRKAIQFFENRFKSQNCLKFLIFGNSYEWNLKNAPNQTNILVIKPLSAAVDLCILSRCNHTIISTGTYGWWAGYLAGGDATYMYDQCRPNSSLCNNYSPLEYINPQWNWFAL